jgi:GNAT superfamily N-acetyltransferase
VRSREVEEWTIRVATAADADGMADAHRDSIRTLGPAQYPPAVVDDWFAAVAPAMYVDAMAMGEVFFVAVAADGTVLGLASDFALDGRRHGASAYVRGAVARRGLGTALLQAAEGHARAAGATSIDVDASLGGVPFYRANGFVATAPGETQLPTGRTMPCVFMRKMLLLEAGDGEPVVRTQQV